jgi:hypothetical protein
MPIRNDFLSVPRLLFILALGLLAVVAFPTRALALGDYIGVEAAPWFQGFDGKIAIDSNGTQGTLIDLKNDLGLANRDTTPMGRVWFRWGKSRLILDYYDSSRTGRSVLSRSLTFNGTTYSGGETVSTDFGLKLMQAQLRFTPIDLKVVEFGFGLGLSAAKVNFDLDGSVNGRTTFDKTVPFPTVNAGVVVKFIPGCHLRAEVSGLPLTISGKHLDVLDGRVQLESYFLHSFGIFGGYRVYRFSVDANDYGHAESTFKGPFIGLGLKF